MSELPKPDIAAPYGWGDYSLSQMQAALDEIKRLRGQVIRQRRELRRLNRTLAPYWKGRFDGFRHGIEISVRSAVAKEQEELLEQLRDIYGEKR